MQHLKIGLLAGAVFVPKPYHGSNIVDAIGSFPDMRARLAAP